MSKACICLFMLGLWLAVSTGKLNAQQFLIEGFETVPPSGWTIQNNSSPIGTTSWQQGNPAIFPAHAGPANSYAMADFNNAGGTGTISSWLISPQITFVNGGVIKFWTRTRTASVFPDRLQIRISTNGTSTNVGTTATSVGDFSVLMQDINPTYQTGTYPEVWTEFTITINGLSAPTNGRIAFRYFVQNGGPTGDNANVIGLDTFRYQGIIEPPLPNTPVDFNGDGKTDYSIIRNVGGGANGQVRWFCQLSGTNTTTAIDWGLASDRFLAEDFDGDGRDDITVWRPGAPTVAAFYILQSSTNTFRIEPFGQTGDDPTVVDDYNGDGRADLAVYRPGANAGAASVWYYRTTSGGAVSFVSWGVSGDTPAPGDYDGDGRTDFAVQRITDGAGVFWTRLASGAIQSAFAYGLDDTVAPGDYDGDTKTDLAVVRASGGSLIWYWRSSINGAVSQFVFGLSSDYAAQGDYDGDGKTDIAVYRTSAVTGESAFWVRNSSTGTVSTFAFGINGDFPVAAFNTH